MSYYNCIINQIHVQIKNKLIIIKLKILLINKLKKLIKLINNFTNKLINLKFKKNKLKLYKVNKNLRK